MWITGLGFGGMFFLYPGADALISILAFVCGLGAASGAAVAPSIQSDVIDYDEYRTGKRKEGTGEETDAEYDCQYGGEKRVAEW